MVHSIHSSIILFALVQLSSMLDSLNGPVVNTVKGTIKGYYYQENNTVLAKVFSNIPYAQAPVGNLRFEAPKPLDDWKGEMDGTQDLVWCIQFWYSDPNIERRNMTEDCLRLNIIVPYATKTADKIQYPVLLWLHGGSYQVGGGNNLPISGTARNLVSRDIIVVIINYRLGPFGFLSKLRPGFAGNYGLEDMIMALKWVRENIGAFGGDKNKVTLGGESAGAASVSLLAISPRTKGIVHGAIMRSGSSLAGWAVRTVNTELNSGELIKDVGCARNDFDIDSIKYCMKHWATVKRIRAAWTKLFFADVEYVIKDKKVIPKFFNHPFLAHTYFTPVVDSFRQNLSIVPDNPREIMSNGGIRVPAMMGVTTGENSNYVAWLYYLYQSNSTGISLDDLEFIVPKVSYRNSDQIQQAVEERYVISADHVPLHKFPRVLINISSDQNFIAPATIEAGFYARANKPLYAYVFEHFNEYLNEKTKKLELYDVGSGHGQDMVYIFQNTSVVNPTGTGLNWTVTDHWITNFLAKTVANFVKFGNPSEGDDPFPWPSFSSKSGPKMALFINPSPKLINFFPEINYFWDKTIPLIDILRLDKGYQYFEEPFDCMVIQCGINYKFAFYIVLAFCAVLFMILSMLCCLQLCAKRREAFLLSRM